MSADVFLSHKSKDKPRIQILLAGLQAAGLNVWWDGDTAGGASWRKTILAELNTARCVLVCWSQASVEAEWVLEEAERAKQRGVLLPVNIDAVLPPFGFSERQALDLVGWRGDPADPRWQRVLAAVQAIVTGTPSPPVQPLPAPLRWPRRVIAAGAVAAVATGAWLSIQPAPADAEAWDKLVQRPASATPLQRADFQAYLSRFPSGAHTKEARERLAACQDKPISSWKRQDDTLPLLVPAQQASTQVAARSALVAVLSEEAKQLCAPYAKDPERHRLLGAKPDDAAIRCEQREHGQWRCGFDGQITCELELRQTTTHEACL